VLHFPASTPVASSTASLASLPAPSKTISNKPASNEDALADAIRKAWMQDRTTPIQQPMLVESRERLTGTKG
jgi:hypothetical protein